MAQILIGNVKGPAGPTGQTGATGADGEAATVDVGTVTTAAYGTPASVTNSGTESAAVLDFVIPQGPPGETTTDAAPLTLGSITSTSASMPTFSAGEVLSVVFGKIQKWMSDVVTTLSDKLDTSKVYNGLDQENSGYALDARQGQALNDKITYTEIVQSGGTTGTYTLKTSPNIRHIIALGHSSQSALCGLYIVITSSVIATIVDAPSVTLSLSNGVLTVTNNATQSLNGVII